MKEVLLMDKYPIFTKEILKSETKISNIDTYVDILRKKIESDNVAIFISTFDHYSHTKDLNWYILDWMIAWKILIFCFWQDLKNPLSMAVRPRNISIAEFEDKFIFSFLEAPNEKANDKKISWILDSIEY